MMRSFFLYKMREKFEDNKGQTEHNVILNTVVCIEIFMWLQNCIFLHWLHEHLRWDNSSTCELPNCSSKLPNLHAILMCSRLDSHKNMSSGGWICVKFFPPILFLNNYLWLVSHNWSKQLPWQPSTGYLIVAWFSYFIDFIMIISNS